SNTFMSDALAKKVLDSKLPIWTRGLDRVALLKPLGSGAKLTARREMIRYLGYKMSALPKESHPLQLQRAKSLQPLGYPLFEEFEFAAAKRPEGTARVKILTIDNPSI